jgi:hypothetical protein
MVIDLTLTQALEIARTYYDGGSDVLTLSKSPGENVGSLEWWQLDRGRKGDRGWRGLRDGAALATYRDLSRHSTEPMPNNEFPTEFGLRDGGWCRPDKDIVKQGLVRRYLEPVEDNGRVIRFRLTGSALRNLSELGYSAAL